MLELLCNAPKKINLFEFIVILFKMKVNAVLIYYK
jgi:hypothetical protein